MLDHFLRFLLTLTALFSGTVFAAFLLLQLPVSVTTLSPLVMALLSIFAIAVASSHFLARLSKYDSYPVFLLIAIVLLLVTFTAELFIYVWAEESLFTSATGVLVAWLFASFLISYLLDDRRYRIKADS